MELYLNGTIILAFLFGPKLYVLLSYEPIIIECNYGITISSARNSTSSCRTLNDSNNEKTNEKQFDLFETGNKTFDYNISLKLDWSPTPIPLHSPTLSSSTRTSLSPNYISKNSHTSRNIFGSAGGDSSPNMSLRNGAPIFQTVLRKKHALRRAHSVNEPHIIMGSGAVVFNPNQKHNKSSK